MRATVTGLVAAGLAGVAVAQPAAAPVLPGWMAGCWIEQKDAAWTEECWTSAKGDVMIGSGRSGRGDRVTSWETMQILRESASLAFYGAPRALNRTRFAQRPGGRPGGQGVTFVNPGHDFPQRISYWREGEFLVAEASLADGSRAQRWRFKRM